MAWRLRHAARPSSTATRQGVGVDALATGLQPAGVRTEPGQARSRLELGAAPVALVRVTLNGNRLEQRCENRTRRQTVEARRRRSLDGDRRAERVERMRIEREGQGLRTTAHQHGANARAPTSLRAGRSTSSRRRCAGAARSHRRRQPVGSELTPESPPPAARRGLGWALAGRLPARQERVHRRLGTGLGLHEDALRRRGRP